jgi:hypothetical protein
VNAEAGGQKTRGGGIGLGLRLLNGGDQLVISATQQLGYRVRRRRFGGFGFGLSVN